MVFYILFFFHAFLMVLHSNTDEQNFGNVNHPAQFSPTRKQNQCGQSYSYCVCAENAPSKELEAHHRELTLYNGTLSNVFIMAILSHHVTVMTNTHMP